MGLYQTKKMFLYNKGNNYQVEETGYRMEERKSLPDIHLSED
jgi:hypothetical protein